MHFSSLQAALLPGLKWLCFCFFCLGLSLIFLETPNERADKTFVQGMMHLNQAQASDISPVLRADLLDQAKEIFETALDLNPDHAAAWKALGHTLQQSGAPLEANLAYNASAHLAGKPQRSFVASSPALQKLSFLQLSSAALR